MEEVTLFDVFVKKGQVVYEWTAPNGEEYTNFELRLKKPIEFEGESYPYALMHLGGEDYFHVFTYQKEIKFSTNEAEWEPRLKILKAKILDNVIEYKREVYDEVCTKLRSLYNEIVESIKKIMKERGEESVEIKHMPIIISQTDMGGYEDSIAEVKIVKDELIFIGEEMTEYKTTDISFYNMLDVLDDITR